ncbi:pyroglutamyl-peptidase I [Alkalibacillus almallahensis]|uniref:pyroglutamyl-peptidase I n=1 Tax=Alkalibacillus almallahensis TaxID=1379154 RepID=UPI0014244CBE|nr:pyroglutamyl-peptidase I [Alkalibacillus almallahensis]NIK12093.1 pyroglutamyl-peptidase [Alkalibacillus almallahensis]
MKRLLLTGFEPFLNFPINPTKTIAEALDGQQIGEYEIISRILPVDFATSGEAITQAISDLEPDAIVALGLAGGRHKVTPERIAINCNGGVEADNQGYIPDGEPIVEDGPDGIFSTLPIQKMVDQMKEAGYPAEISNSAGTYLCNHVMYRALYTIKSQAEQISCGFIHMPASHELAIQHGKLPSWSQSDLQRAVEICLNTIGADS